MTRKWTEFFLASSFLCQYVEGRESCLKVDIEDMTVQNADGTRLEWKMRSNSWGSQYSPSIAAAERPLIRRMLGIAGDAPTAPKDPGLVNCPYPMRDASVDPRFLLLSSNPAVTTMEQSSALDLCNFSISFPIDSG
jgi:hypothetical protein